MSIERLRKAVAPQSQPAAPDHLRADDDSPFVLARDGDEPFLGIMPIAFVAAGGLLVLTLLVFILGTA